VVWLAADGVAGRITTFTKLLDFGPVIQQVASQVSRATALGIASASSGRAGHNQDVFGVRLPVYRPP